MGFSLFVIRLLNPSHQVALALTVHNLFFVMVNHTLHRHGETPAGIRYTRQCSSRAR